MIPWHWSFRGDYRGTVPWWILWITVWLFIVLFLLCCRPGSLESHRGIFNPGQTKASVCFCRAENVWRAFFPLEHYCGVTVHNDLWCDRLSDCHKSLKTNYIANSKKSTVKRCNLWDRTGRVRMNTSETPALILIPLVLDYASDERSGEHWTERNPRHL